MFTIDPIPPSLSEDPAVISTLVIGLNLAQDRWLFSKICSFGFRPECILSLGIVLLGYWMKVYQLSWRALLNVSGNLSKAFIVFRIQMTPAPSLKHLPFWARSHPEFRFVMIRPLTWLNVWQPT